MQFSSKILSVGGFYIIEDSLYCFSLDGKLDRYDNFKWRWSTQSNTQYSLINVSENELCSWWQFTRLVKFNKKNGAILSDIETPSFKPLFSKDGIIFGVIILTSIEDNSLFSFGQLNQENKSEILVETDKYMPIYAFENNIICQYFHAYSCYDLITGKKKWDIDISEWEKYCTNVGLKNGQTNLRIVHTTPTSIWVNTSWGTGSIDIKTGKLKWFKEIYPFTRQGKLIALHAKCEYREYDTETGDVIFSTDMKDILTLNKDYPDYGKIDLIGDRHVILIDGFMNSKAIIFDKYSGKKVWECAFLNEDGSKIGIATDSLQVHNNRIYILDNNQTLHIFEDEVTSVSSFK